MNEALDEKKIALLRKNTTFVYLPEVESTFIEMKRLAHAGAADGSVVLAERQTAGRGRLGRRWVSSPGSGLYFSYLIKKPLPADKAARLTPALAVAVCSALRDCELKDAHIKWPNDIIAGGRKLCGILCEMELDASGGLAYAQAGVGLNVHKYPVPEDLKDKVAFCDEFIAVSRQNLLIAVLSRIDELCALAVKDFSRVLAQYRALCYTLGKQVSASGGQSAEGIAVDIGEECELIVRDDSGTLHALRTADVSLRGVMGYV